MNYKKLLTIPLMLLAINSLSYGECRFPANAISPYEGAGVMYSRGTFNNSENNWRVHDNSPTGALTDNKLDNECKWAINLQGEGRSNAYFLGAKNTKSSQAWNDTNNKVFSWKMKIQEKFRITVYADTSKGKRAFQITHSSKSKGLYKKKYIGIGLTKKSLDGTWQEHEIDLSAKLKEYEPDNKITAIHGIKVRGSGWFDDIRLIPSPDSRLNYKKNIFPYVNAVCDKKKAPDKNVVCFKDEDWGQRLAYFLNKEKSGEYFLYAVEDKHDYRMQRTSLGNGNIKIEKFNDRLLQVSNKTPLIEDASFYTVTNDRMAYSNPINVLGINKKDIYYTDSITPLEDGKISVALHYSQDPSDKAIDIYDWEGLKMKLISTTRTKP